MSDKTRREFLKDCYKIGGYAGVACLGMGAVDDAMGLGILPALTFFDGVSAGTSWATWSETHEEGWGDSANTVIALAENPSASGNEVGQGAGLPEADRTFTQAGALPGATGSPPTRAFASPCQLFWTDGLHDGVLGNRNVWTHLVKIEDIADGATQLFIDSTSPRTYFYKQADNTFIFNMDNGAISHTTTDVMTASGIVYVCTWSDGTYIRSGFTIGTKPTKWSDFDVGKRNSTTSATARLLHSSGTIGFNQSGNFGTFKLHYIVFSKTCLIDNAS